jgi:hypothetical protein
VDKPGQEHHACASLPTFAAFHGILVDAVESALSGNGKEFKRIACIFIRLLRSVQDIHSFVISGIRHQPVMSSGPLCILLSGFVSPYVLLLLARGGGKLLI